MKRLLGLLVAGVMILPMLGAEEANRNSMPLDDIILDIYRAVTEIGETDYEQLQTDLYALHESPINLNATSEEELSQLLFLSPQQIDDILAYADRHPFASVYELRMIPSLADYEIRDLLPFVRAGDAPSSDKMYAREVLHYGKHEVLARVDARNIEHFEGSDPMYVQGRYRFNYQRRVMLGLQLRRPSGVGANGLQYGGFLQLKDLGCLHTLVAGHFQASFGQGLVLAPVFRSGKSAYVSNVGMTTEGLRYYSSADGEGMQGAGATLRWKWGKQTRLDVSALYSLKRANDSTLHHLVGANITLRHKKLQVELTAIENIWSDSIRPYRDAAYNEHYFRGRNQAVVGASARYNHGWFDLFGEVATAQNASHQPSEASKPRWGVGTIVGSRFYPMEGVSLILLYRYYSPWFDNALGYAFSETSRIGDENGLYVGFELTRWKNWRLSGYADLFRFSGIKYGIPYAPSLGYDALAEVQYYRGGTGKGLRVTGRLRAREKGGKATYSARGQFDWMSGGWALRSTAEANLVHEKTEPLTYGVTVFQDIGYTFARVPLALRARVQFFDAREWNNRIYCYEHDVLYAFSIPAVYGLGGRAYMCLRWQIIDQLALYLRISETVYGSRWYAEHHPEWNMRGVPTRTDVHLLLRAQL